MKDVGQEVSEGEKLSLLVSPSPPSREGLRFDAVTATASKLDSLSYFSSLSLTPTRFRILASHVILIPGRLAVPRTRYAAEKERESFLSRERDRV